MELNPPREAASRSPSDEFPNISWKQNVLYRVGGTC